MNKTELEEAAGNLADPNLCKTDNCIAGAKWQAERMYSEEDMKKAYERGMFAIIETGHGDTFDEWFKQFKKK